MRWKLEWVNFRKDAWDCYYEQGKKNWPKGWSARPQSWSQKQFAGRTSAPGARSSQVSITFRPVKLFYACRVCIQDQSFNNFENGTMKLSVNEAKLTGLWARNFATIQLVLISKFAFEPEKLTGLSRNGLLFPSRFLSGEFDRRLLYCCPRLSSLGGVTGKLLNMDISKRKIFFTLQKTLIRMPLSQQSSYS